MCGVRFDRRKPQFVLVRVVTELDLYFVLRTVQLHVHRVSVQSVHNAPRAALRYDGRKGVSETKNTAPRTRLLGEKESWEANCTIATHNVRRRAYCAKVELCVEGNRAFGKGLGTAGDD